jgi:hypothetical protein
LKAISISPRNNGVYRVSGENEAAQIPSFSRYGGDAFWDVSRRYLPKR